MKLTKTLFFCFVLPKLNSHIHWLLRSDSQHCTPPQFSATALKMKLFGWVQSKLANAGRPVTKKPDSIAATHQRVVMKQEPREEFSDWPHSLLAIGTFGNTDLKQRPQIREIEEHPQIETDPNPSSSDEFSDFTPEEVGKLQKELTKLLTRKPSPEKERQGSDLPLDRFLNCPSSLEVDRRVGDASCGGDSEGDDEIDRTISVIIGKCKEICADKRRKGSVGKRSVSFLLKRVFACGAGGFRPAPSLRESLQESRMEKLLRTILHKKIFAQNASREASNKKYLQDKKMDHEDERLEKGSDGKWVKTDSEYIVLEI